MSNTREPVDSAIKPSEKEAGIIIPAQLGSTGPLMWLCSPVARSSGPTSVATF